MWYDLEQAPSNNAWAEYGNPQTDKLDYDVSPLERDETFDGVIRWSDFGLIYKKPNEFRPQIIGGSVEIDFDLEEHLKHLKSSESQD